MSSQHKCKQQETGGGYIGHHMYVLNIDRAKTEIEHLKSEGFEVLRMPWHEDTTFELGQWSKQIAEGMTMSILIAEYKYSPVPGRGHPSGHGLFLID